MPTSALDVLLDSLVGSLAVERGQVLVKNELKVRDKVDGLIHEAVFGETEARSAARWLIWEAAQTMGIRPASIQDFYLARGKGEIARSFTVPAMNLRMLAYDSARAVFRAARKIEAGAIIFEIARSEIGYTDQRPSEYASAVLAAAIKEKFRGPVFIQGDHYQASQKKFNQDREAELRSIRGLMLESVASGFFNIDIDSSTLVDLTKPTLEEQQRLNYETCAEFTRFIREHEPEAVTISVGGEIGEVGQKNSTPEDLDAFMAGYNKIRGDLTGISKISIQTGTSHGGVVLPDGTLAKVAIDFDVLKALSEKARRQYGLAGAVQHGASTLPDAAFNKFVEAGTCEVHLATAFQTLIIEHRATPESLRMEMYDWVRKNAADERKPKDTEAQFLYKTRKKAVGPLKKQFWSLPAPAREEIGADLEKQFSFLFEQLGVAGTAELVTRFVQAPEIHHPVTLGGTKTAE